MRVVLMGFLMLTASMCAQDAASIAMQQTEMANQAAIQANQQAMDQAQRDSQQAQQNAQSAADISQGLPITRQPQFSVNSGRIAQGTQVRIKCPTHYAAIYYTTDGWSPTLASNRYAGPITIDRDTVLQAIAVAPNMVRSLITRAQFTVPGSKPEASSTLTTDGVLRSGSRLQLTTASEINSKTAQIGDKLTLRLENDVIAGEKVIIPKGTIVEALVTQADPAGHLGTPGDLSFEVKSLTAHGITVPLRGGATLEGTSHYKRTVGLFMVPVVGEAGLLAHGEEAIIKPGMAVSVTVDADTPLLPAANR